jgi:hypothetical protein
MDSVFKKPFLYCLLVNKINNGSGREGERERGREGEKERGREVKKVSIQ